MFSLSQVLDCIRLLQKSSSLPLQRAQMRIRITLPAEDGAKLIGRITSTAEAVEKDDLGEKVWTVVSPQRRVSFLRSLFFFSVSLGHA